MAALPVEWVLVIYYGPSAHRATYGRITDKIDKKYTKDYIQLSRKSSFIDTLTNLFPETNTGGGTARLVYKWPAGTAPGALVLKSADRPHLKWETSLGAPQVWKMSLTPSEVSAETIPGDPSHLEVAAAEEELALLQRRGAGQPYLMAIKLRDEAETLHLRAYLRNPSEDYEWASLQLVPQSIQALATNTSQSSALDWSVIESAGESPSPGINDALLQLMASNDPKAVIETLDGDTCQALATYLQNPARGLFFDPTRNHDAWLEPVPLSAGIESSIDEILGALEAHFPVIQHGDAAAEALWASADEVDTFRAQIEQQNYEVPDSHATVKTRGSAQRAFAEAVKKNYGFQCAITGIKSRDFLIASHIVPWSADQSIRLDPANGICLSLLVDRAFEGGYLLVEDDLTIRINWNKVGDDQALERLLGPYDGQKLNAPGKGMPKQDYLQRRRALICATE